LPAADPEAESRQAVSPAEARFQLLQGGRGPAARLEVFDRIRSRWGEEAVREARKRIETGTDLEARAWLRRSAYFLDLPSLLDLERKLPVLHVRIQDLFALLTAADRPVRSLVLVRFTALDLLEWSRAEEAVPWLEDMPQSSRAIQHLCGQGWLLVGCPSREQARALSQSMLRGRGIRASTCDFG
jgi:hypothetical protein